MQSKDIVNERRRKAAAAWNATNEVILIGAGMPISIPGGADQTFTYHPHPEYTWLTGGRTREGGVLAFDPNDGWTLFEPPVTELERIWGGSEPPIGEPIENLDKWIEQRKDKKTVWLGVSKNGTADENLTNEFRTKLTHARRSKDEAEIELIKKAVEATKAGHIAMSKALKPGVTERELQIELETAMFKAGADEMGYHTTICSGPNSAVFHFTPGARKVQPQEFVLVDAGGSVNGYTADVTRTYSSTEFTPKQKWLRESVIEAKRKAIEACVIGAEWLEIHRIAAHSMAGSLKHGGILKCSADEAIESEAIALFFAHGIGHMVGLGVRDASGPLPGRKGDQKSAGIKVRMDLPMEAGYLVTVEPGLYFIPALLKDPARREKFKEQVNWNEVDPWIGQGGVRQEDNVLVTKSGPLNLTKEIPE